MLCLVFARCGVFVLLCSVCVHAQKLLGFSHLGRGGPRRGRAGRESLSTPVWTGYPVRRSSTPRRPIEDRYKHIYAAPRMRLDGHERRRHAAWRHGPAGCRFGSSCAPPGQGLAASESAALCATPWLGGRHGGSHLILAPGGRARSAPRGLPNCGRVLRRYDTKPYLPQGVQQ